MRVVIFGTLIAVTLTGCGGLIVRDLQRQSARGIYPHPYPDSVTVSDVHGRGSRWLATTSGGVYDCSVEAGEDMPLCVKRQGAP